MKKRISLILAIIMVATIAIAALPISASAMTAPTEPTIAGAPTDIVATITVEGDTPVNITRAEFTTKFASKGSITNAAPYKGANYTVEILRDIDAGEDELRFYVSAGCTATLKGTPKGDGTNTVLMGSNSGNPVVRFNGPTDGTINVQNLDLYTTKSALLQYYDGVVVNITDSNWTGKCGIRPTGAGTINVKSGTKIIVKDEAVYTDNYGKNSQSANAFTVEAGAEIGRASDDTARTVIDVSYPAKNDNFVITINGGKVNGTIKMSKGILNLTSGTLNGDYNVSNDVMVEKADAFVIDKTAIVTTTPFTLDESVPTITGGANDIVAEVYVTGETTPKLQVKRSEFATFFSHRNANKLTTEASLMDKNITIKILMDIDVGEVELAFIAYPGKTVTVEGNNKTLLGYDANNPVMRFKSASDKGNFVVNNLTIFGARASALQYYGNLKITFNNSTIHSFKHTAIWPTSSGAEAVLTIATGSTVSSGGCAINAAGTAGNIIIIEEGAKVISTGSTAISVGSPTDIEVYGEIVCETDNGFALKVKAEAAGGLLTVDGGKITGDVEFAPMYYVDLVAGEIDGEVTFPDAEENKPGVITIAPEFIIAGETNIAAPGEENNGSDNTTTDAQGGNDDPAGEGTTTDAQGGSNDPEGTTTATEGGNDDPAGEGTTTVADETTTEATPGETTPDAPAAEGGCAGCAAGDGATAAIALAIAMAAAVAIIVKRK